jgi:hypothetical protein
MTDVMAIGSWHNNAEMIADMPKLGYLHQDWVTLDPTYGQGRFWTNFRPTYLVASDIDTSTLAFERWDFTDLPVDNDTYEAVVFDPPYKLNGTSTGKGSSALDAGYGVGGEYVTWRGRHELIRAGISECVRVLKPAQFLLVKCQDQVSSGAVRWQTREFSDHAESIGCRLVDMLHLPGHRQQPDRGQQHARRNYSTLLVFKKNGRRKQ